MFRKLKGKFGAKPPVHALEHALRPTLFGDVPLQSWAKNGSGEPWESFARAMECLRAADRSGARAALSAILQQLAPESRQYPQAWHALGALGDAPPAERAKHVYGVVQHAAREDSFELNRSEGAAS